MKQFKLKIENREGLGRGPARRLRQSGRIPACIYGRHGTRSISISVDEFRVLRREIGGGASLLELEDEKGESVLTLVREMQRHAVKDHVQHIDFQEIERGHTFVAEVPVHLSGEAEAPGVRNNGGLIDHQVHTLEVRCRPSKLPSFIEADVSKLNIGESLHVGDLVAVDGVEFVAEPDRVVVYCSPPTVSVAKTETDEEVAVTDVPATKVKTESESAEGADKAD